MAAIIPPLSTRSFGQVAYEAYFDHCDGRSLVSGAALPGWDAHSEEIQQAWEAAGQAVVERYAMREA